MKRQIAVLLTVVLLLTALPVFYVSATSKSVTFEVVAVNNVVGKSKSEMAFQVIAKSTGDSFDTWGVDFTLDLPTGFTIKDSSYSAANGATSFFGGSALANSTSKRFGITRLEEDGMNFAAGAEQSIADFILVFDNTVELNSEYSIGLRNAKVLDETDLGFAPTVVVATLTIVDDLDLSAAEIELEDGPFYYTGEAIEPAVVSVTIDGVEVPSSMYDVRYGTNEEDGTNIWVAKGGTVIVTAKEPNAGGYKNSTSVDFDITPRLAPTIDPDELASVKVNTEFTREIKLSDYTYVSEIEWQLLDEENVDFAFPETEPNLNWEIVEDEENGDYILISGKAKKEATYVFTAGADFKFISDEDGPKPIETVTMTYEFVVDKSGGVYYPGIAGGGYISSVTTTPVTDISSSIAEDAFNGGLTVTGGGASFTQKQLQAAYKAGYLTITGKSTKAADGTPRPVVFTLAVSAINRALNATKNLSKPFEFIFDTSAGAFHLPANIVSMIPKYKQLVSGKGDVFVKVIITEKKSTAKGELTPVTDFKFQLVDGKGAEIATIKNFISPITRTLPLKKDTEVSAYYGTKNRADSTKTWDNNFLPTLFENNKFRISSKTTSEYVVTEFKNKFTDVEEGKWYEISAITSASKGLINGMTETTFEPETALTRAMFAKMIDSVLQLPEPAEGTRVFSDLASVESWGKDPIQRVRSAGLAALLTTGTNEFKPDQNITREEMAYILAKAAEYAKLSAEKTALDLSAIFSDSGEIGANYASYIESTVNLKLLEGNADGTFNPKGELTRAQGVTALLRLCRALGYIDPLK